jgi:hypothetical protein
MVWANRPSTTDVPDLVDLRLQQPNPARIYDYLLGGKDHYGLDRQAADVLLQAAPDLLTTARAGRDFMCRAVRYLAADLGIRQFLDLGAGIPSAPNLHEVVQAVTPDARVVYVDNDLVVLSHARALFTSTTDGTVACLDADLLRPETILSSSPLQATFDPGQPLAITMFAVLHVVADDRRAGRIVARLLDPWPAGSAVAVSTLTRDYAPQQAAQLGHACRRLGLTAAQRSRSEVSHILSGLRCVSPGVVPVHRWRPDPDEPPVRDDQMLLCGGVAIKSDQQ